MLNLTKVLEWVYSLFFQPYPGCLFKVEGLFQGGLFDYLEYIKQDLHRYIDDEASGGPVSRSFHRSVQDN